MHKFKLVDLIGGLIAVEHKDATKVYNTIFPLLKKGEKVHIRMDKIQVLIPHFVNAAFGRLYMKMDPKKIKQLLKFGSMDEDVKYILDNQLKFAEETYYINHKAKLEKRRKQKEGIDGTVS